MLMSHARNGDEFRTPRHCGSPANVEVLAFVILVNPKPVWNSWTLACYHGMASTSWGKKYCPIWCMLWYKLLTNQSFSQEASWFHQGNMSPLWTKRYSSPLLPLNFFPGVNIEQQECCVCFWNFWGFVWTFLYINWVLQTFYVHNSNLNYMHILQCI